MDEQAKVRQFMVQVKGLEPPTSPVLPDLQVRTLCTQLVAEEYAELALAVAHKDIVEIAHELADLLYVCYYMANAYGLIIEPIFSAIHIANMTKKGGPISEDGKQLKPERFVPADVAYLVKMQQWLRE